MRPIPPKVKAQILGDPYYRVCARIDEHCAGRLTWEHCWIYSGRQINRKWAIIPLCWYHHLGQGLNKEMNQWISLTRATKADLAEFPNKNWEQIINHLQNKYGQID